MRWPKVGGKRPTLLLRCLLLIAAELAVNALLWIVSAIVFRQRPRFLTLCLLAWIEPAVWDKIVGTLVVQLSHAMK